MGQSTRYLGIDPGTHCGYAVLDNEGIWVTSGVWDLKPNRFEGGGMRWVHLERYLRDLIEPNNYGETPRLAYEEVRRHLGVDAAHIYGGCIATIQRTCEILSIPYMAVPVGTVKKLATGKGSASKEDMLKAAQERWGTAHVKSDDEADALWIAESVRQALRS